MPARLHVAVLGCGKAAATHVGVLRAVDPDVVYSFASRDLDRARDFRRRHRGETAFGSYAEAIGNPDVDAVLVTTPPSLHLDLVLRALRAGKHAIVEKPPFLRSADFDAVAAESRARGRQVLVAENYPYKPLARSLREVIEGGALGEILFLHVNALKTQRTEDWRDDPSLAGGGAFFEGGIHWVSLLNSLAPGLEPVAGQVVGPDPARERSVLAVFRYASGAVATLSYSWEVHAPLHGLLRVSRIYGRRGSLAFESNGLLLAAWGGARRLTVPGLRDINGRKAMMLDFLRALRTGAEPFMTLSRARRDLELVEAIYRSAGLRPGVHA